MTVTGWTDHSVDVRHTAAPQLVAAGRLKKAAPGARVACGECDVVGHLLVPGAARLLRGVHDHLHHRGAPTASVVPQEDGRAAA